MSSPFPKFIASLALAAALVLPTHADQRRFAYSYETTTAPKGSWEIETTIDFKRSALHDNDLNSWQFRHEIEYGVTSRFQLAVYVANWDFAPRGGGESEAEEHDSNAEVGGATPSESETAGEPEHSDSKLQKPHRSARYASSGVELIYNISNPNTDWIGSAAYLEANIGDRYAELEGKILLQKNFGPLAIVYNAVLELEWEGSHLEQEEMEFAQTVGVSYQLHPNFAVGAELVHEIDMPEWKASNAERAHIYAGPNATFHAKEFFATVAALWRTTDTPGEPDMQARLIVGFDF